MSRTARRLLAAECSVFLDCADLHREQWEPYFDWTSKVGQLDTIISFNYDRVVETLYSTDGSKVSNIGFPLEVMMSLWNYAREVIEQADAVVFIGYRFPETDANARRRLLAALRRNGKHDLFVHTVLGPPDLNRSHQVRMEHLLRSALTTTDRKQRVAGKSSDKWSHFWEHPMYAQDFFTVVAREQLFTERPLR